MSNWVIFSYGIKNVVHTVGLTNISSSPYKFVEWVIIIDGEFIFTNLSIPTSNSYVNFCSFNTFTTSNIVKVNGFNVGPNC